MSDAMKVDLWRQWRAGDSISVISRALGKPPGSVFTVLKHHGGIAPAERVRRADHLSAEDRAVPINGTRPYAHLREEFESRLAVLLQTGDTPDPRDAQIHRLKEQIATLEQRLAHRDQTIEELTDFRNEALSRLAAQHEEILQLRRQHDRDTRVRRVPARAEGIGPCS
ncbi:hypothetical protein [Streptosporangium sp. KLBMP 9127]|nr:hypothetical protein [Streptosporangium sp. KLBMP 9127]